MRVPSLTHPLISKNRNEATGYRHPDYVAAFSQFGQPLHLRHCNGWLLQRPIPGTSLKDAMGSYPLFCCDDWDSLGRDLDEISSHLVTLVLVTEPFGDFDPHSLERCFDHVVPYKAHYVADMNRPLDQIVKRSHQATVRRAQKKVDVRICSQPGQYLDQWNQLFNNLIRRHDIKGMRAFSKEIFARHLEIPGLVMFEARAENHTVGLDLWYVHEDVAYGHLVAFSELGYKLRASYATKWAVLDYFKDKVRWVDLGGIAGNQKPENDGLTKFKEGWSTDTKSVYLCKRIFQPTRYEELCDVTGTKEAAYFPAYRDAEHE